MQQSPQPSPMYDNPKGSPMYPSSEKGTFPQPYHQPYRPSQSSLGAHSGQQPFPRGTHQGPPPAYSSSVSGTYNPSFQLDTSVSPASTRTGLLMNKGGYQETSEDKNTRYIIALVCILVAIAIIALIIGVSYYLHTPAYQFGKYDRTRIEGGERT